VLEMTYQILFLAVPLLFAAVAQGFVLKYEVFRFLKRPLDFGLYFRGKRVFGDNKTWRGLVTNGFFCVVGTFFQALLQKKGVVPEWLSLLDYRQNAPIVGVLLGLGMTLGELPNSFLKRQLRIPPGGKKRGPLGLIFFLLDQVDLALGIWVFLYFLLRPGLCFFLWSLVVTFVLHAAVSSVGYLLKMRQTLA
jgi:CDP-diglyceride synthetase